MKYDAKFLREHIQSILDFYHPRVIDNELGGYYGGLLDDGTIYDARTRHLVDCCRHIFNFSEGYRLTKRAEYAEAARHGLRFLNTAHALPGGGYAWILDGRTIVDDDRYCYGHAFVMLAFATAKRAGIDEAGEQIGELWNLLERYFYDASTALYVDVIDGNDWTKIDPYRGQNANMHMCEAMLAAYQATGEARYFERAYSLAKRVCVDLTQNTGGYIWEHYDSQWQQDWDYNKDDPKNLFRTYGYLPGHFIEWAKLLLIINQIQSEDWLIKHANLLFDAAIEHGFNAARNTFDYTFSPEGKVLDDERYYWVTAEAIGAAALMASVGKREEAWQYYERFWDYADAHFIDHEFGGWYRVLSPEGEKLSNEKSPPAKTDYHPLGAAYLALDICEVYRP